MKTHIDIPNVEETAHTIITNAGFRDSRVVPTRVVKGMLIQALRGAMRREQKIMQMLADFPSPEPWPWDRLGTKERVKHEA